MRVRAPTARAAAGGGGATQQAAMAASGIRERFPSPAAAGFRGAKGRAAKCRCRGALAPCYGSVGPVRCRGKSMRKSKRVCSVRAAFGRITAIASLAAAATAAQRGLC